MVNDIFSFVRKSFCRVVEATDRMSKFNCLDLLRTASKSDLDRYGRSNGRRRRRPLVVKYSSSLNWLIVGGRRHDHVRAA